MINLKKYEDNLIFIPISGSNEIGMNMNLYQYQGKWLIIDMGAGFTDDYLPGIDMIVPDIQFLEKIKHDIVGLVLTHAHEDHVGGVEHLWPHVECPIYATPFTAHFLRAKLAETDFYRQVKIIEVQQGSKLELGPFKLELVPLSHSAPEMQAIFIHTELGNVMHTGDWKFDNQPLIGEANDEKLLANYGNNGILAMVGDSTNVFKEDYSGSEGELRESLIKLIAQCSQRIAITTFASNLARIETIVKAAEACGRKIAVAGRSLWRVIQAAQQTGYLQNVEFLGDDQVMRYPKDEILLICTGCQGEPFAAMTKIATNSHPTVKLGKDDTVIFSSKIIPGNEKSISRIFNMLTKNQVEVLTERDHFVHVSGHPSRPELERMYKLIKPAIAIPVHGEAIHIHEHAKLARKLGVPQAIEVENGAIVQLAPGEGKIIGKLPIEYLAIDGSYLIPCNSAVMKTRRRMRDNGIVIICLYLTQAKQLAAAPLVTAPGLLDNRADEELITMLQELVISNLQNNHAKINVKHKNDEAIIALARQAVRKLITRQLGKDPAIEVYITYVS